MNLPELKSHHVIHCDMMYENRSDITEKDLEVANANLDGLAWNKHKLKSPFIEAHFWMDAKKMYSLARYYPI